MTTLRPLLAIWLGLLALLAIEAAGGRLLGLGLATPAIGALMATIVAITLMRAREGAPPIRLFICFGAFWLAVLLGLGMMDPLTRTNHPLPNITLR